MIFLIILRHELSSCLGKLVHGMHLSDLSMMINHVCFSSDF